MKITVISSSLRRNGNSEMLADEFIRGAKESGNEVEKITLGGKKINFCIGCLSCQKTGKCVIKDDCAEINEKIHDADVLVFATPIYYYEMSGQLKRFSTVQIRFMIPIIVSRMFMFFRRRQKMKNMFRSVPKRGSAAG